MTPHDTDPTTRLDLPLAALADLARLELADQERLENPPHPYDSPSIRASIAEARAAIAQRTPQELAARKITEDARAQIFHAKQMRTCTAQFVRGVLNQAWARMRAAGCSDAYQDALHKIVKENSL